MTREAKNGHVRDNPLSAELILHLIIGRTRNPRRNEIDERFGIDDTGKLFISDAFSAQRVIIVKDSFEGYRTPSLGF